MYSQGMPRLKIEQNLYGPVGVAMLGRHEPLGRVGADRKQGQVRPSEALAHGPEDAAAAVAAIAGEVEESDRRSKHEAAPERHPAIARPARGPVIGGHDV